MADRKRRTRRTRRTARKVEDVVEEQDTATEEEKEEVTEAITKRKRRTRRKREPTIVAEEEEEEEDNQEEEEEAPKPVNKNKRIRVRAVSKANGSEGEEEATALPGQPATEEEISKTVRSNLPQTLNMALDGQLVLDMLEAMRTGETYVIGKINDEQWRIAISKEALVVTTGKKLKGVAYDREVCTQEFLDWKKEWQAMSTEEKIHHAEELGVEWEQHETARINLMRAGLAVREHLEIDKYKPQYQSRNARASIRAD